MPKMGMFEQKTDPNTGETFTVTSGRGRYNNVKGADGESFKSHSSNPERMTNDRHWQREFNLLPGQLR